ncbi:hypothetical protein BDP55DRAFT_672232 [Colletotrichum godetiae]|uniref:Uncharacterized protein n=1 Tax=Colletotrichum godetiae TaxID=1209918 RepID=A0AAJ0ESU2_9PEZI|nr:uncharacterized protein BDP55DRAFT_672232 [Colletotrichum godetiae]KAK1672668.1 hypothetical protein BDP55DRAFT_672232 [Colletotrichum godetiae]
MCRCIRLIVPHRLFPAISPSMGPGEQTSSAPAPRPSSDIHISLLRSKAFVCRPTTKRRSPTIQSSRAPAPGPHTKRHAPSNHIPPRERQGM